MLGVTVSNGVSNQFYELAEDFPLDNLLAIVMAELGQESDDVKNVKLFKDGKNLINSDADLAKTLKELGVMNNDMLLYVHKVPTATSSTPQVPNLFSGASTSVNPQLSSQLANLVKAIKVPPKMAATSKTKPVETSELRSARKLFDACKDPRVKSMLKDNAPYLLEMFDKDNNDFDGFLIGYRRYVSEELRKKQLMADPTSEEGQKLIQEQIAKENIDYSYGQAMEHTPEAYIPVTMLYIKMIINGHPVKAFVDSGAQVSVMSLACARRCNLEHLIDKRFQGTVRGVGGAQNFAGKIHMCQVQVEDHYFPCYFDVLADREMDLLLGLNILKRHHCSIDLKQNKLLFGDGTSTPFLSDKEVSDHLDDLAGHETTKEETTFEIDAEKLAEVIALGFEEEEAKNELKNTRNNLEAAVNNLFAKKSEDMEH